MESMQAKALRPSLCGELTQREFSEEIFYNTVTHTAVSCVSAGEDSLVDEFLDLQNVDFEEKQQQEEEKYSLSFDDDSSNLSCAFSESQLASELAVPDDDIAGLEWVSHFVDDSISEFSLYSSENNQFRPANRDEPEPNRTEPACAPSFPSIPVKPRTKRSRPVTRPSPLSPLSESSSTSSTSSPSTSFGFPPCFFFAGPVRTAKTGGEQERKKQKRKPLVQAGSALAGQQFQRRCSHCQVQKTPQWRAGPLGAKTLCNACGVRFKSGRLFPEYRPACSPTFSSAVHSNSHRKVLEMRKKKELVGPGPGPGPGSGLTQVISTF